MATRRPAKRPSPTPPPPSAPDRFELYERCVTLPGPTARFLEAVHGRRPRVLGEDFSGTGALARAWAGLSPGHRAVCVDRDPEPLGRLAGIERVAARRTDVLRARDAVDVLACTNFPLGYFHTRAALLAYLRHARSRLNPRGVLVADLYGGSNAMTPGRYTRDLRGPGGTYVEYTWEQRAADPLTSRVTNAIHFRVSATRGGRARVLREAFTYDWRLWGIAELRDAMAEAGFARTAVYHRLAVAVDGRGRALVEPVVDGAELPDPWVVYVCGRR